MEASSKSFSGFRAELWTPLQSYFDFSRCIADGLTGLDNLRTVEAFVYFPTFDSAIYEGVYIPSTMYILGFGVFEYGLYMIGETMNVEVFSSHLQSLS